jgi:hypothetical protein
MLRGRDGKGRESGIEHWKAWEQKWAYRLVIPEGRPVGVKEVASAFRRLAEELEKAGEANGVEKVEILCLPAVLPDPSRVDGSPGERRFGIYITGEGSQPA